MVAPVIAFPIYWADPERRALGPNQACIRALDFFGQEDVIGKAPFNYCPDEAAREVHADVDPVTTIVGQGFFFR